MSEAKLKKIYLQNDVDVRKEINNIANQIYTTYLPLIEEEINIKSVEFLNSEGFKKSVSAELELNKKKLSCKALKKFQEFEIHIPNNFWKICMKK